MILVNELFDVLINDFFLLWWLGLFFNFMVYFHGGFSRWPVASNNSYCRDKVGLKVLFKFLL